VTFARLIVVGFGRARGGVGLRCAREVTAFDLDQRPFAGVDFSEELATDGDVE